MSNILIIAKPDDNDATYVAQAIELRGATAFRWDTSTLSVDQSVTLLCDETHSGGHAATPAGGFDLLGNNRSFDAVWVRSPDNPVVPASIHPEDRRLVEVENKMFLDWLLRSAVADSFWVNPWHAGRAADNKIAQLVLARQLGMRVPKTCISNCAEDIKAFCRSLPASRVIYKTFRFHAWQPRNGARKAAYANIVDPSRLPSDAMLRATPGIFQEFIEKDGDVRTVFFGAACFSILLKDQGVDWRRNHVMDQSVAEPCELPEALRMQCRQMMTTLGLHVAAFDFARDRNGQLHFLEVNEAGRFLWMEEECPDLPVLDAFVAFLLARRSDFTYEPRRETARLRLESLQEIYRQDKEREVELE